MRPLTVLTRPTLPRPAALLLAGAAVAVALGGCSGGDDVTTVPGGGGTEQTSDGDTPVTSVPVPTSTEPATSTTPPPGGAAAEADLTVVLDDGAGTTSTSTLTCSGTEVGGTLATAAQACAQLAELGSQAFAPPPKDQMCTEIYGGPQTATITGTFAGAEVEATLARTNGCEIGRWDALSALVGAAGEN